MKHSATLIISLFALFFVAISVGVYFLFFFKHSPKNFQNIKLVNLTDNSTQTILGNITLNLSPREERNIQLQLGSTLQTNLLSIESGFQEPLSNFELLLSDEDINTVFITYSGLRSNLSSINGRLWNNSGFPIMFVMVSPIDKRRWPVILLYPDEYKEMIIPFFSIWQVTLSYKDQVIASTLFFTEGSEIIFNGSQLLIK